MYTHKTRPATLSKSPAQRFGGVHLDDNRRQSTLQRRAYSAIKASANNTGLPDDLKASVEQLSGYSLDDVRVHYDSPRPAALQAHAFTLGTNIHLAANQERHLPHEAWHVVQQKQGRVKPTLQMAGNLSVNDDAALEKEADVMGDRARSHKGTSQMSLQNSPVSPVLQGKFLSLSEKRYLTVEEICENVRGKVRYEGNLENAIKKLAEGPNIPFESTEELPSIIQRALVLHGRNIEADKGTAEAQWRKVNRIAGLMEVELFGITEIPAELKPFMARFQQSFNILTHLLNPQYRREKPEVIEHSMEHSVLLARSIREYLKLHGSFFMGQLYNFLGHLPPLANALANMAPHIPTVAAKAAEISHELQSIRQLMAASPHGVSVVAHRGAGPTNRTMGALIREDDQRRKFRPAENSPEAFKAAFRSVTAGRQDHAMAAASADGGAAASAAAEHSAKPALDGVECDVFLSRDSIPMLSHEGNVHEQLNAARKALFRDDRREIHEFDASELTALQRTERPASRFMTLADLLQMSAPVAHHYYAVTGKPFRIEVEMKGIKVHGKKDAMRTTVAKVVSQFRKRDPSLPIEIILFNGDLEQVEAYAALRHQKTALGGLYTGLNYDPEKHRPHPLRVDELRAMLKSDIEVVPLLEHFIITLVFGQEMVPAALASVLGRFEPSAPIDYNRGGKPRDPGSPKELEAELEALRKWHRLIAEPRNEALIRKLHVLTDYPVKAHWLKSAGLIAAEIERLDRKLGD